MHFEDKATVRGRDVRYVDDERNAEKKQDDDAYSTASLPSPLPTVGEWCRSMTELWRGTFIRQ